ncbi:MAG: hypothetical protein LUB56_00310 [Coprobacillus sp.]|nr:hypothetical protein [Coprobacillus sp.]
MKKSLLSIALLTAFSLGLTSCVEAIPPIYTGEEDVYEHGSGTSEHTEHIYDEGVVTKEASCTEEGEITYTCTICGDTYIGKIDPLGHDYIMTETAPTCVDDGYYTKVCARCENLQTEASGKAATGVHTYGDYIYDETNPDLGHYRECSACGYKEESVHTFEDVVTSPTCVEQGYTTKVCECGYSYVDSESYVAATGEHTYVVGTLTWQEENFYNKVMCSVCGQTLGEVDSSGTDTDDNGHCPSTESYLAPSPDEYSGTPRSSKSKYGIIGSITNYGDTEVQVSLDVDPVTRFWFGQCDCNCYDVGCYILGDYDAYIRGQTCPRTECCDFCKTILGYEATIDEHFDLNYAYSTESVDYNITLENNDIDLTGVEHNEAFTVGAGETLYIYASFIWISDIEGCVGTDADAFDTFIGSSWSDIQFGILFNLAE